MINFLPRTLSEQYNFGRRNAVLGRWILALLLGLIGVGMVTFSGWLYLHNAVQTYTKRAAETQQRLSAQNFDAVTQQSTTVTTSLTLAVNVLSREVLFSELLKQMGAVIPPNVILTDLKISDVARAINITAMATDYSSATQLQVNLQDPTNKIFSHVDIQSITCSASATDPHYPCTATLRAIFAADNPFLFIHSEDK